MGHRPSTETYIYAPKLNIRFLQSSQFGLSKVLPLPMAFALLPLQESDIPRCVTIYFAAFQNPHSLGCWPRTPSVRAWWEDLINDELHAPGARWLKAVSVESGSIAGFIKWQESKPGVVPDADLPEWPQGADSSLCNETFGAWARAHRDLMGSRGHWCKFSGVSALIVAGGVVDATLQILK